MLSCVISRFQCHMLGTQVCRCIWSVRSYFRLVVFERLIIEGMYGLSLWLIIDYRCQSEWLSLWCTHAKQLVFHWGIYFLGCPCLYSKGSGVREHQGMQTGMYHSQKVQFERCRHLLAFFEKLKPLDCSDLSWGLYSNSRISSSLGESTRKYLE